MMDGKTGAAEINDRLKSTREAASMSVEQAARALHFSSTQIKALEANDSTAFRSMAYMNGFRNTYARFLGVQMPVELSSPQPHLNLQQDSVAVLPRSINWWIMGTVALAIVAAIIYFLPMHFVEPPSTSGQTIANASSHEIAKSLPSPSESAAATAAVSADVVKPDVASLPAVTVPAVANASETSENTKTIMLKTIGDSWVSVTDKQGHVLFQKLMPADSRQSIKGQPPFHLVVGRGDQIKIEYDGNPVKLAGSLGREQLVLP